jgi:hypothetical protein
MSLQDGENLFHPGRNGVRWLKALNGPKVLKNSQKTRHIVGKFTGQ